MSSQEDPLIGRTVGNYRLVEQIGNGAYGEVYRVEHVRLGVFYAAKILHPSFTHQDKALKRFWREAQTTSRLKHENIISVIDFDVDAKIGPYLVMEFLEGETLGQRLEREKTLPLESIREVAKPICLALEAAHQSGVIHRDLKPDNVFLAQRMGHETVKILDFGIARLTEGGAEALTGIGQTLGTPEYMSPEQCRGLSLTAQSDIYCFGILLYQMLEGKLPFEGHDPHEFMVHHLMTPPPSLRSTFPKELGVILAALLEKQPENRPSSMEEVWKQLTRILPRRTQSTFPEEQALASQHLKAIAEAASGAETTTSSDEVILLVKRKEPEPPKQMYVDEALTQIDLDAVENQQPVAGSSDSYCIVGQVYDEGELPHLEKTFAENTKPMALSDELEETIEVIDVPVDTPVVDVHISTFLDIAVEDKKMFRQEFLHHFDEGGMFLPSTTPLAEGELFFFRFSFPNGQTFISGWGEVRRLVLPGEGKQAGMDIRFTRLEPSARKIVADMLRSY